MKNLIPTFLLIFAFSINCKTASETVFVNENISISLPADYTITEEGNSKTLEANLDNDKIKVFKILLDLPDTLSLETKKQYFITNINSFIKTFDFINLDTTLSYHGNHIQSDITFDYNDHDKPCKFYGRFIVQNKNFIAICYQMSNPDNNSSIGIKNKLFNSIKIK
jgi:hypothetical protein